MEAKISESRALVAGDVSTPTLFELSIDVEPTAANADVRLDVRSHLATKNLECVALIDAMECASGTTYDGRRFRLCVVDRIGVDRSGFVTVRPAAVASNFENTIDAPPSSGVRGAKIIVSAIVRAVEN